MHTPAIGKQLLRFVPLAVLFAPTHAPYAQPLTFDTTTVLTSSPNPSLVGDPVTLVAEVAAQEGAPPVAGSVTFVDTISGATLDTVTLSLGGSAVFQTTALAADDHLITATYSGTSELNPSSASLTQAVNGPAAAIPTEAPTDVPTNTPTDIPPATNTPADTSTSIFTPTATDTATPITTNAPTAEQDSANNPDFDSNVAVNTFALVNILTDVYLEDSGTGTPIEDGDTVNMGFVEAGTTDSTVTISSVAGTSYPGIYTDIDSSLPLEVAPHSDQMIRLFCFSPVPGTVSTNLTIGTSAGDFNFTVICTVVEGSPDIQITHVSAGTEVLSGDAVDLGSTGVGVPFDRTFRIENVGTGVLQTINFGLMPPGLTYYTASSLPGLDCTPGVLGGGRLGPGECFDLILTCSGSAAGTFGGAVLINSNDPDEPLLLPIASAMA